MSKLKVLELFGGIGACSKALERLGVDYEIADYVEIDKYAVASFNAIHGTNFEPQDITNWNKDIEVDLIMHGSPCQDFSLAGLQAGGDEGSGTRSSLMYETIRIVDKLKPKYVIWENVKNLLSKKHIHNFNTYLKTMEQLGYTNHYQVLNAKDYGIPQNRERVFTISIRKDLEQPFAFPPAQELKLRLKDMLKEEVDDKYYLSDKMIKCFLSESENSKFPRKERFLQTLKLTNEKGIAATLCTTNGSRATDNYLLIKNATKKGYLEAQEGDDVDISSRMEYHRGTVQKGKIQTLTTMGGENNGVVVKPKVLTGFGKIGSTGQYHQQNRVYDDNVAISVTTAFNPYYLSDLAIRKLTPRECGRLMGVRDEDITNMLKNQSDSSAYHCFGDSIVVDVLMAIFKELFFDNK